MDTALTPLPPALAPLEGLASPTTATVSADVPHVRGADLIARTLCEIGVDTVFCYPGGANLEMLDALSAVAIRLVRTEHEQGAVFAAQGYARATGRLGVCLATSGPGATNLVTGIADANSDSVPLLALTGNVATHWLGKNAFQEVDIVAVTRPITKRAEQVRSADQIAPALRAAAVLALDGRPGPVLLDFPKDVQQARGTDSASAEFAESMESALSSASGGLDAEALGKITAWLAASRKPVIYAGGGVIASGTGAWLARLAERLDCPVALTMMGLGALPDEHPLLLGPLGMHGAYCANVAVNEADLVLALGVRFDDRVIGQPDAFARHAKIVHIDVDASEIGKNVPVHLGVRADLRDALPALARAADAASPADTRAWRTYLADAARAHPLRTHAAPSGDTKDAPLHGAQAIAALVGVLPPEAIVATGVGQHQMWAMQYLRARRARTFLSSAGFGTMGFGLPAALGAKMAAPDVPVIDIDGDGSLNMSVNELATCRRHGLGVKVFVSTINGSAWCANGRTWCIAVIGSYRRWAM